MVNTLKKSKRIKTLPDNFNFIFFGCWNKGLCGSNNDLTKTMRRLKEYVSLENIQFVVVAGDNYYPDKINKKKTINMINLNSGFECLKDAVSGVKTTILLGNHDIEYINPDEDEKVDEVKNCLITQTQQQIIAETNVKTNAETQQFYLFDFQKGYEIINNNTIIIYLDSSIFDEELLEKNNNIKCYKNFPLIQKNAENLEISNIELYNIILKIQQDIADEITTNIINADNTNITNVVFTAHHPIFGCKEKNGNQKFVIMPKFVEFICNNYCNKIKKLVSYYHLCADIHNYQNTILEINDISNDKKFTLRQYIVGTGGADKDELLTDPNKVINFNNDNYNIKMNVVYSKKENGFLRASITENGLIFKFISAEDEPVIPVIPQNTKKRKREQPHIKTSNSFSGGKYRRRATTRRKKNKRKTFFYLKN